MKDNKHSDNGGAQLSPEELIRMLKNQLNIEPADNDPEEPFQSEAPTVPQESTEQSPLDAGTEALTPDSEVLPEEDDAAEEPLTGEDPTEEDFSPVITDAGHDPKEYAQKEDEVDFFSFLAGGKIAVDELKDEPVVPDLTGDEDVKLFRADPAPKKADLSPTKKEDTDSDSADDFSAVPSAEDISSAVTEEAGEDAEVLDEAILSDGIIPTEEEPLEESAASDAEEAEETESDEIAVPDGESDAISREDTKETPAVGGEEGAVPEETDYSFDENRLEMLDKNDADKNPDFNMLLALGVSLDEVERIYGKDAAEKYKELIGNDFLEKLPDDIYEYTSPSQNTEIKGYLRKEKNVAFIKLCAAAVLLLLALLFENLPMLGVHYSGWLDQVKYPIVHIMVDFQLVLIAAALALDELIDGVVALFRRSPNTNSLLAAVFSVNFIFTIVLCFLKDQRGEARLIGASVIFMAFLCLLISFFRLFHNADAFQLASSNGLKCCVMTASDADSADRATFAEELAESGRSEDAKVLSFRRARFINGFFSKTGDENVTTVDRILIPAALVFAVLAFVLSIIKEKNVSNALYAFNCASVFLFPVSVFAVGAFTFFRVGRSASAMKAAILGEKAPFDTAGASIVAFEDKDAFPSYCIKLRNLKVYGKTEVVDVLRITASVFRKIGGPLNDVLECATAELEKSDSLKILRHSPNGLEVDYDGRRVLLGKAEFLNDFGIVPYSDVDDREYLKSGDVSVLYVAIDRELCAKYYIQYTLDVDFQTLLRELNHSGVSVAIRTSDPNIDLRLLQSKLNLRKASVRIVYRAPGEDRNASLDMAESGVIGSGTPCELVHTAMLCERLVHVLRTNNIVKALSLLVGVILLVLFTLLSVNLNVYSLLLIIYQLFWMLPTFIVSKLFL